MVQEGDQRAWLPLSTDWRGPNGAGFCFTPWPETKRGHYLASDPLEDLSKRKLSKVFFEKLDMFSPVQDPWPGYLFGHLCSDLAPAHIMRDWHADKLYLASHLLSWPMAPVASDFLQFKSCQKNKKLFLSSPFSDRNGWINPCQSWFGWIGFAAPLFYWVIQPGCRFYSHQHLW